MSITEKKLYQEIVIEGNRAETIPVSSKAYKGISTVASKSGNYKLYDISLIKQDILNHFHIKRGEKLENPQFGTIIWDILFEPLTDDNKRLIAADITGIVNYDPRVSVDSIIVDSYENGIIVECTLTYLPYNISESMKLKFDQDAGFLD